MSNDKKSDLLDMPFTTVRSKLMKKVLFDILEKSGMNVCYRCGKKIEIQDLTFDHKKAWLNSDTPKELFFDVDNVAFSHHKCNSGAITKGFSRVNAQGEKNIQHKLRDFEVLEILTKLNQGKGLRELSKEYGVHHKTIANIKNGKRSIPK